MTWVEAEGLYVESEAFKVDKYYKIFSGDQRCHRDFLEPRWSDTLLYVSVPHVTRTLDKTHSVTATRASVISVGVGFEPCRLIPGLYNGAFQLHWFYNAA
jgi:hypothetical protein